MKKIGLSKLRKARLLALSGFDRVYFVFYLTWSNQNQQAESFHKTQRAMMSCLSLMAEQVEISP